MMHDSAQHTSKRPPADLLPEDLHTLRPLLPACTTQLLSRLPDALRSVLPRFHDAPALTIDGTAFVAHLLRYLIRSPRNRLSHAPSATF